MRPAAHVSLRGSGGELRRDASGEDAARIFIFPNPLHSGWTAVICAGFLPP